jgi:hypothetical protein
VRRANPSHSISQFFFLLLSWSDSKTTSYWKLNWTISPKSLPRSRIIPTWRNSSKCWGKTNPSPPSFVVVAES